MSSQYRKPATGSDARAMTRNRSNAAGIAAALAFYAGSRPPPDPKKETAAGAGTPAADDDDFDNRRAEHTEPAGHIQSAALARRAP